MHRQLSKEVQDEVRKLLPQLRIEVQKEFLHWDMYTDTADFHSDEKVIEVFPYCAYEYILLSWGIEPDRVTITSVVHALNNRLFGDLRHITCHALRRLALKHSGTKKD